MTRSFTAGAQRATTTISAAQAAKATRPAKARREVSQAAASDDTVCVAKPGAKRKKGRPSARPYEEGRGWCLRVRYNGHDIYVSGQKSEAAAKKAARKRCDEIDENKVPLREGPQANTLAQALQDYALDCLPFKKGAVQEARRINVYLRHAGLQTLVLTPWDEQADGTDEAAHDKQAAGDDSGDAAAPTCYFEVALEPCSEERTIPGSLAKHRQALLTKTARTDKYRAVLAGTTVDKVSRHNLQGLINAMRRDRIAPATIALERSIFRVLFNHAFVDWNWTSLKDNPATMLKMPKVKNIRKRTFSDQELTALDEALATCHNGIAAAAIALLRETAMRATEPLDKVTWGDINWERRILRLQDDKAGEGRDVALNAAAIQILKSLGPGKPSEPILKISYEGIKAAMKRACERAGISNARLHDLRRTAATRAAKLSGGNVFIVQLRTGHKTLAMTQRYVQLTADDLVSLEREHEAQQAKLAQAQESAACAAPARLELVRATAEPQTPAPQHSLAGNVVPFRRRAA